MKYTEITEEQMSDLLKEDKGWMKAIQAGTKEVVYQWDLKAVPGVVIKVYSSIKNGVGRGKGKDAIRVCAVNTVTNRGWIKATHVKRVEGWRTNLQKRVLTVIDESKARR
jgi:hypothetical protein